MATVKILYGKTADRLENYLKEREQDHQEIGCKVITTEHSCFLNGMASEFKQVQADCGSEGNDALHIIQSWSPEESKQLTAEQVNVMGMEMVQKFSEGHQFIIQTHTDEAHFHNHIIVNPVHMETGKRIQNKRKNLYQLRDINDDIARAHGLSVLPKQPKLKRSGPSEKVRRIEAYRGKSYIIDLGKKAQFARSYATGMDDYCSILSGFNISTRVENKNITYFYPGRNVGKRGRNLSHELDLEGLEKKFLENRTRIQSEPNFRKLVEQVKGSYSPPYKSGVPPSKESRPSKEDELRIIPPDALKHAKQQSILKYCSESKIELSQTKDGRKVIAGREHLEVSDYLWINHKNKTRGNVIDFVSTHRNCSLMDAISHLTGKTEDEAKLLEGDVRRDLALGNDPRPLEAVQEEHRTVSEIVVLFLESAKFLTSKPLWREETRRRINKDVLPRIGKMKFKDLKKESVLKFYLALKERGLSHASIQKYHALICALGDVYAEVELDGDNPIRRIRDFKKYFPDQPSSREINFLTPEELDSLFLAAQQSNCKMLFPFIKFVAHTGLRRGEALKARWVDIDGNREFLHIRDSKNGKPRRIPLEMGAIEALGLLERRSEFIFTKENGKRYNDRYLLKPLKVAAVEAGIDKRIDVHTLRHSWGSNKIRQGWGIKKVSMMLGHSDISITSRVYTHLLDGDLRVRDDFNFDNQQSSANDRITGLEKMTMLLRDVISELGESQEETVRAAAEQAISSLQLPSRLLMRQPSLNSSDSSLPSSSSTAMLAGGLAKVVPQQDSSSNDKIESSATVISVEGVNVPHMPRRSFASPALFPQSGPPENKKAQDLAILGDFLLELKWRPHGDSNPGYRRERAMS
ncbi:unnamed protein product [Sphagnum tenellum]